MCFIIEILTKYTLFELITTTGKQDYGLFLKKKNNNPAMNM